MEDDHEALVIDIGTGTMKAGFCFDDAPKHLIPMVLGKAKNASVLVGMDQKDWFIGEEAIEKKAVLNLEYPVQDGYIRDSQGIDHIREIIENLIHAGFTDALVTVLDAVAAARGETREQLAASSSATARAFFRL